MQIAIIAPIPALDLCAYGDIDMCLAHLALESNFYFQYYKQQAEKGRFVILDNGENEGRQITDNTLIELAIELKVSEVIAPDTFRNMYDTNYKLCRFKDSEKFKLLKKQGIKVQAVVQGNNIFEAVQHFKFLENFECVDTIGLGFKCYNTTYIEHETLAGMMSRIFVTNSIVHSVKPVHLLGLYNPLELKYQKIHSWIRSNDSSSAIMCALADKRYGTIAEMFTYIKPQKHLDFTSILTNKQRQDTIYNIHKIKEWINEQIKI